jgi:hypothetical protein
MATIINCKTGQTTAFLNVPVTVASVAAETQITVNVTPGTPVDLMMTGTLAWIYRATTAVTTNDQPVAAGQALTLRFYANTVFYILRSAADGAVTFVPLAVSKTIP